MPHCHMPTISLCAIPNHYSTTAGISPLFSAGERSFLLRRSHAAIYVPCQITYICPRPHGGIEAVTLGMVGVVKSNVRHTWKTNSSKIHSKILNDYITLVRPSLLSNKM